MNRIEIYTDGSCHTLTKTGAWAAILLLNEEEVILNGTVIHATHHQMELLAVIRSLEYLQSNCPGCKELKINTDSQYLMGIVSKKERIVRNNYLTKRGSPIRNMELVKLFLQLSEFYLIHFYKVKAHSRVGDPTGYNRRVDKLARKILRELLGNVD